MTITKSLAKFLYDAYGGDMIDENGVCVGFDFTLDEPSDYLEYIASTQRLKKRRGYLSVKRFEGFVYYRVDCPSEWFRGECWK